MCYEHEHILFSATVLEDITIGKVMLGSEPGSI